MKDIDGKYLIALRAALAASTKINEIYSTPFENEIKADGSPVTKADLASSEIIKSFLSETNIPIIGEELEKEPYSIRKKWRQCWCVDPLDGTKEFIKKNGEFVVNIALIEDGCPIFGLIASPVQKEIIFGGMGLTKAYKTSFLNIENSLEWTTLKPLNNHNYPPVVISSRSDFSGDLLKIVTPLETAFGGYVSKTMGSALKFFDLCEGKADIYPRLAPTMEWDIAAGQAIYEVLGGEILNFKTKEALVYNKKELFNPYFIARNKSLDNQL